MRKYSWMALVVAAVFAFMCIPAFGQQPAQSQQQMKGDIYSKLDQEHDTALKQLKDLQDKDKKETAMQTYNQLKQSLTMHMQGEEKFFYPALQNEQLAGRAKQEHEQARQTLQQLASLQPGTDQWNNTAKKLETQIKDHVKFEKDQLYPVAKKLSQSQQQQIFQQYAQFEQDQMMKAKQLPGADQQKKEGTQKQDMKQTPSSGGQLK